MSGDDNEIQVELTVLISPGSRLDGTLYTVSAGLRSICHEVSMDEALEHIGVFLEGAETDRP